MNTFFNSNLTAWDRGLRVIGGSALVAGVFYLESAALAPWTLLTPYLLGTAIIAWDPAYSVLSLLRHLPGNRWSRPAALTPSHSA